MHHRIFDQQVLPVKDKMFRFALRLLGSSNDAAEDAKDVVQDALLKIWNQKESLKKVENPEAWCMQVTKNLCLDRLKALKIRRQAFQKLGEIGNAVDPQTPYEKTVQSDNMSKIKRMINELPEKFQMVIHLRDIEGFTYQEIADILEWSMEEVKVNLFRARKRLKDKFIKNKAYGIS